VQFTVANDSHVPPDRAHFWFVLFSRLRTNKFSFLVCRTRCFCSNLPITPIVRDLQIIADDRSALPCCAHITQISRDLHIISNRPTLTCCAHSTEERWCWLFRWTAAFRRFGSPRATRCTWQGSVSSCACTRGRPSRDGQRFVGPPIDVHVKLARFGDSGVVAVLKAPNLPSLWSVHPIDDFFCSQFRGKPQAVATFLRVWIV
jgi:hypothetical protein